MTSSPFIAGPWVTVPSMRPLAVPPARLPACPTVAEPDPPDGDPDELAVPAAFVPGFAPALFCGWPVLPSALGYLVTEVPPTLSGTGPIFELFAVAGAAAAPLALVVPLPEFP